MSCPDSIPSALASSVRDTCFYDGQCGLCRRSTLILRRLDWLHRLDFRDMNASPDLPVTPDVAMRGMPMRTWRGTILVGFPAVRRALLQTPLGAAVALPLYVPGLSHLAARVYRRIAANRGRDTCNTPPPRSCHASSS
jgi:predicted DCC family thiol-disulfide oxidoreductase YuxK